MQILRSTLTVVVTTFAVMVFGLSLFAQQKSDPGKTSEAVIKASLAKLAEGDLGLAESQRYCAVQSDSRLGSVGVPVKVVVSGQTIFLCCESCRPTAVKDPKATLAKVQKVKKAAAALAKLPAADQDAAEAQRYCPTMADSRLGSMGVPVKIMIDKTAVFLCCEGCREEALAESKATLAKVQELQAKFSPQEAKAK